MSYSENKLHIFADKELPPLNKRAVKINNEYLNTINGESVKTIINANNKINLNRYKLKSYKPYLTFSSPSSFTLNTKSTHYWDGTVEYSTDTTTWTTWDGSFINSENNKLYLRGKGNTIISGPADLICPFTFTGDEISCDGNIETLLDYEMVMRGEHPQMENACFAGLFSGTSEHINPLIKGPDLPATELSWSCYVEMFSWSAVTTAPKLPATTLTPSCYADMFYGCPNLTNPPALPATELEMGCYLGMFGRCFNLTSLPILPATILPWACYQSMFSQCPNIRLSTVQTEEYNIPFRIPYSGNSTETEDNSLEHMFWFTGGTFTDTPEINTTYYLAAPQKYKPYLTFSSPNSFTLSTKAKDWDGVVEYFNEDTYVWEEWKDDAVLQSGYGNRLYLRGKGNTHVSIDEYKELDNPFVFTGSEISCDGNIETLLDYELVMQGIHPPMAEFCFYGLFEGNYNNLNPIIKGPDLPATDLTRFCYACMYPYTTLSIAPELPATTLTDYCYYGMFECCPELEIPPVIYATTMAPSSCCYMFALCPSLKVAPELPATTLAENCYSLMFTECTRLTTLPKLPAMVLQPSCYNDMFNGCENIKLSSVQTPEYSIPFRIPDSGVGTDASMAMDGMFLNTGGDVTGTININTTYYTTPLRPTYDINITHGVTDRFSSVYSIYIRVNKKPTDVNDNTAYVAPGGEIIGETHAITETLYIWGLGTYKLDGSSEEVLVCDTNGNPIPYTDAIEIPISQNIAIELKAPQPSVSQGDVIRLTDTGNSYKVLAQVARGYRLMDVSSTTQSKYNTQSKTMDAHGVTIQKYFDSTLKDAVSTYYNNLPTSIKGAIKGSGWAGIPNKEFGINVEAWYADDTETPSYKGVYQSSGNLYNYQLSLLNYSMSSYTKCYPPSIKDIFKYLGVTSDMTFDNTTLTSENIWELFFPAETSYPVNKKIWLGNANANNSSRVFCIDGNTGKIDTCLYSNTNYVCPIFIIDLEQVEFDIIKKQH